jgi:hypothetical protein
MQRLQLLFGFAVLLGAAGPIGVSADTPPPQQAALCPRFDVVRERFGPRSEPCRKVGETALFDVYVLGDLKFPNGTEIEKIPSDADLVIGAERAEEFIKEWIPEDRYRAMASRRVNLYFDNLRTAEFFKNSTLKAYKSFQPKPDPENGLTVVFDVVIAATDPNWHAVLVHEIQHVAQDVGFDGVGVAGEEFWLDEGFSLFLEEQAGGDVSLFKMRSRHQRGPLVWDRRTPECADASYCYGLAYYAVRNLFERRGHDGIVEAIGNPAFGLKTWELPTSRTSWIFTGGGSRARKSTSGLWPSPLGSSAIKGTGFSFRSWVDFQSR